MDLHSDKISNSQMGMVFEELIRKFAEISNETAGEHFTPREVIRLMVNLLFIEDDQVLAKPWKPTSSVKCSPMPLKRGLTAAKPKSAMKSRSTVISMCSSRRVNWLRLMRA